MPLKTIARVDRAVHASLQWARKHPEQCMQYIRQHAQEMQDSVLQSHISLYVNDYSVHIGDEGKEAVRELLSRGRAAGIFPQAGGGAEVFVA